MGLLDSIVGRCFRSGKTGRVVVFPGHRAYLVKSETEEQKIKAVLKMFFSAHLSILLLSYFLASEWSRELVYALGRPAEHLLRDAGIFLGIYSVVAFPYFLFWRTYKKAIFSFVSAQDEVAVSGRPAFPPRLALVVIGLIVLGMAALIGATWFVRAK
jgi:hypothetical protein